jgi:predicted permease
MTNWTARLRSELAATGHQADDDVVEELGQHLHDIVDRAIAGGLSPEVAEARAEAQIAVWRHDADALRRVPARAPAPSPPPISTAHAIGVVQDIRYAARLLCKQLRHALIAIATLALGIGFSTALFGVSYAVLLKPLPWPDADRLVVATETRGGRPPRFGEFSSAAFVAWREKPATLDDIAAWTRFTATYADRGDPERIPVARATASLFRVLRVRPAVGRLFTADDERSDDSVLLAESLWQSRYARDPFVVGRIVHLDGRRRRVIGVVPDATAFPDREVRGWVPLLVAPPAGDSLAMFNVVGRLRPGVTAAQAGAEATARGQNAARTDMAALAIFGDAGRIEVAAQPLGEALTAGVRRPLVVLLVAVGFLMLTATANLASLQLARTMARRRELAIRAALGAGPGRVARQLAVESLLLGLVGGGAGLALAIAVQRFARSILPPGFPRIDELGAGPASGLCALALGVVASLGFGLAPVLGLLRLNLAEPLADGLAPSGGSMRSGVVRARMAIIAGQVAVACVLLIGAGLLARSFITLLTADRGYDPEGVLTARLALPDALYTPERRYAVVERIVQRLQALPAARRVAFTSELPLTAGGSTSSFVFRTRAGDGSIVSGQASPRIVSPAYFGALNLRLVAGRGFDDAESGHEPTAIVNRSFASRYLGTAPLETRLPIVAYQGAGSGEAATIGIVEDVRYPMNAESGQPEIYYDYRQFRGRLPVPVVTLLVRTAGDPAALAPALHTIVRGADPALVPEAIATMTDRLRGTLAQPRLYALLLATFAGAAIIVASVGLFGVLSYIVAQRSREVAIRLALGAGRRSLVMLVVGQGLAAAGVGVLLGLVCSLALTRSMAVLLYGVSVRDRFTLVLAPAALMLVAAAACIGPALRAVRVDPIRAMRE